MSARPTWGRFRTNLFPRPLAFCLGSRRGWKHMVHRLAWSAFVVGCEWTPARVAWVCDGDVRYPHCHHPSCQERNLALKRREQQARGEAHSSSADRETKLFHMLTNVVGHVTCNCYEDGSPRKPGWVTLRTWNGLWELVAKEPDACLSLSVCDPSLDDCWVLLDTLLGDASAPWQPDPFLAARSTGKKGKGG